MPERKQSAVQSSHSPVTRGIGRQSSVTSSATVSLAASLDFDDASVSVSVWMLRKMSQVSSDMEREIKRSKAYELGISAEKSSADEFCERQLNSAYFVGNFSRMPLTCVKISENLITVS